MMKLKLNFTTKDCLKQEMYSYVQSRNANVTTPQDQISNIFTYSDIFRYIFLAHDTEIQHYSTCQRQQILAHETLYMKIYSDDTQLVLCVERCHYKL